jgi:hypothetical protein
MQELFEHFVAFVGEVRAKKILFGSDEKECIICFGFGFDFGLLTLQYL